MAARALQIFERAYDDPSGVAGTAARAGRKVVRTLGLDAPRELILAAGLLPVRLVAEPGVATPRADTLMGSATMGARGKRLIEQLTDPSAPDLPLLITQADTEQPQIFAALRELGRLGERVPTAVHFLDFLHLERPSSRTYNAHRLSRLSPWLEKISGQKVTPSSLAEAAAMLAEQARLLDRLAALRASASPSVSGADALRIIGASAILPPDEHIRHLSALLGKAESLPQRPGRRLYVTGSPHEHARLYELIESCGAVIVGEDHGWGHRYRVPEASALEALADPALRPVPRTTSAAMRAERLAREVAAGRAEAVLHLSIGGDEAAPWDVAAAKHALRESLPFLALRTNLDGNEGFVAHVEHFLDGEAGEPEPSRAAAKAGASGPAAPKPAEGKRSRKSLESVATFGVYQREWFARLRQEVAEGSPFAVVNANAPQEILRAMDVPFVVNQWWASIVAAKQQSGRYLALLADHDYPTDVEAYSSQGLAATLDGDAELAPWGGLPRPDFLHAVASSEPTFKIFEQWAAETGADHFVYERTVDPRWAITTSWWEDLPERWDEVLEPERIDLMVAELEAVIARIEEKTDRRFSAARLREVMDLVNEQEEYYRRTRDLIATTIPAPIGIVDSMPATMVPQWHRGTVWARDAAKAFYEEVAARAREGLAATPNERIRLMWVGRGLWSDMAFYQKWEESHGAVFVWSMYLALAADGYIRSLDRGRDPMRALAARFLTMGDELRMPTWAGPWHVHEAATHAVDAAVALQDADPFVVRALRAAGVPVLELSVDNFSREGEDQAAIAASITRFIEGPAAERAAARAEDVCVGA
jgi:benzoyl-CoA reductase/2-hydroxyglutaryl-CoA dehydratase subunit BcrC/BadD/HgdB